MQIERGCKLLSLVVILGAIRYLFLARSCYHTPENRTMAAKTHLGNLKLALYHYTNLHGEHPTTTQGLSGLVISPFQSDLEAIPVDPWGRAFRYTSPGKNGELFLIECFGADGRPGGKGENADLTASAP